MHIKSAISNFRAQVKEDTVWGILLFIILFVPLSFAWVTYEKFEIIKLAIWIFGIGFALIIYFKKQATDAVRPQLTGKPWFTVSLFLFLAWAVVATVHSVDHSNSVFGFYPRFVNGLLFYVLWASFIFLMLAKQTKERMNIALLAVFFDGALVALIGTLQSIGLIFYDGTNQLFARSPSLLGNADFSSMFVAALLPLGLILFIRAKERASRIYFGIAIVLFIMSLVTFSSRGAWLAALVGLLFVLLCSLFRKQDRTYALAALVVLVVGTGLWYGSISLTRHISFKAIVSSQEQNIQDRLFVWDIARQGIVTHPWVGVGLGNFQVLFEGLRGKNLSHEAGVFDDPHNLFLSFATTGGIPLLFLFLMLLVVSVMYGWRGFMREGDSVALGIVGSIVALCVAACFTPVTIGCFLLLAVLLCCALAYGGETKAIFIPRSLGIVAQITGLILVVVGICFFGSEVIFWQGYQAYYHNDFKKSYALTSAAIAINPTNQIFYLYRTASEMGLKKDQSTVDQHITQVRTMHTTDEVTYVRSSNLEYLLYRVTGNKIYLQKAIDDMVTSLKLDPFMAEHYGQVSYYMLLEGDTEKALVYDQYGISLEPTSIPSWLVLAHLYQIKNQPKLMLKALESANKLSPDNQILQFLVKQVTTVKDIQTIVIPIGVLPNSLE